MISTDSGLADFRICKERPTWTLQRVLQSCALPGSREFSEAHRGHAQPFMTSADLRMPVWGKKYKLQFWGKTEVTFLY